MERIFVPMLLILAPATMLCRPASIKEYEAGGGTAQPLQQTSIIHLEFDSLGIQILEIHSLAGAYKQPLAYLGTEGYIIIIRHYMAANQAGIPLTQAIWYIPKPGHCSLPAYATPTKAGLYIMPKVGMKAYISKIFKFLRIGKIKQTTHQSNPYFPKWSMGFHVGLTFLITQ